MSADVILASPADLDPDAALTDRARRLGIGLADTMPAPAWDPCPITPARLMPELAQRLATPETAESVNAELLARLRASLDLLTRLHDGCPALTSEALDLLGAEIDAHRAAIAKAEGR